MRLRAAVRVPYLLVWPSGLLLLFAVASQGQNPDRPNKAPFRENVGLEITEIYQEWPADLAGLKVGDIIWEVVGDYTRLRIWTLENLQEALKKNERVSVKVIDRRTNQFSTRPVPRPKGEWRIGVDGVPSRPLPLANTRK